MADGTVGIRQHEAPDRLVDNSVVTNDVGQTVYRQKVHVTNLPATQPVSGTVSLGPGTEYVGFVSQAEIKVTDNGRMFSAGALWANATIGSSTYHLQITNPANSGVSVALRSIIVSCSGTTRVTIHPQELSSATTPLTARNRRNQVSGNPTPVVTVNEVAGDLTTFTGAVAASVVGTTPVDLLQRFHLLMPAATVRRDYLVWVHSVPAGGYVTVTPVWSEGS